VKIKVDDNLPMEVAELLRRAGHDATYRSRGVFEGFQECVKRVMEDRKVPFFLIIGTLA